MDRARAILLAFALGGAACNPAVDPDAVFSARGTVADVAGQPLAGAEVRLIKYEGAGAPAMETFFSTSGGVHVVQTVRTDDRGRFEMSFLGRDIRADGGYTTSDGRVEVATTVIVARDPADASGRTGVFTYPHLYRDNERIWEQPATMTMWRAEAIADTRRAETAGLVDFSWQPVARPKAARNVYRVDVFGEDTARLTARCSEGSGCLRDGDRLVQSLSAFSINNYYSDANTMFAAYVEAKGAEHRYVARFAVNAPMPDVRGARERVPLLGVWAVGAAGEQSLGPAATDNNPIERAPVPIAAAAVYVQLPRAELADAGILNVEVDGAGCLVLELSEQAFAGVAAARASDEGAWTPQGRYCGEEGAGGEITALAGFGPSERPQASWIRLRAEAEPLWIREVGEVAVYATKR